MKNIFKINIALLLTFLVVSFSLAQDQTTNQQIKVEVDGLSCPFCAYGLEKKLMEIDGITKVEISVEKGEALLSLDGETEVDPETVRSEVKKAGFTPREVTFVTSE